MYPACLIAFFNPQEYGGQKSEDDDEGPRPSCSVPIQSCSLVANLMGMKPYRLTGYETGYDSESSGSEFHADYYDDIPRPIAVGAC